MMAPEVNHKRKNRKRECAICRQWRHRKSHFDFIAFHRSSYLLSLLSLSGIRKSTITPNCSVSSRKIHSLFNYTASSFSIVFFLLSKYLSFKVYCSYFVDAAFACDFFFFVLYCLWSSNFFFFGFVFVDILPGIFLSICNICSKPPFVVRFHWSSVLTEEFGLLLCRTRRGRVDALEEAVSLKSIFKKSVSSWY